MHIQTDPDPTNIDTTCPSKTGGENHAESRTSKNLLLYFLFAVDVLFVVFVVIVPFVCLHSFLQLHRDSSATSPRVLQRRDTHHLQQLVALIEVRHDNTLPFRYGTVHADELAVLPHGVNLVQGQLILSRREVSAPRR